MMMILIILMMGMIMMMTMMAMMVLSNVMMMMVIRVPLFCEPTYSCYPHYPALRGDKFKHIDMNRASRNGGEICLLLL
jgi:hypothetical protein